MRIFILKLLIISLVSVQTPGILSTFEFWIQNIWRQQNINQSINTSALDTYFWIKEYILVDNTGLDEKRSSYSTQIEFFY